MKISTIVKKFAKPAVAIVGGIVLLGAGVMNVLTNHETTENDAYSADTDEDDYEMEEISEPSESEETDIPE